MLVLLEVFGGADVRREHAFLDQPVRVVANDRDDPHDLAAHVELELHLDAVEVDRAARFARSLERVEKRVEIGEVPQQRLRRRAARSSGPTASSRPACR